MYSVFVYISKQGWICLYHSTSFHAGSSATHMEISDRISQSTSGLLRQHTCIIENTHILSAYDRFITCVFIPRTALEKESNTSEIFQSHSADLITSIASDLERITDRLFAENIIGQAIVQFTTLGSESNYSKARKVVYELYSQLQAQRNPKQYLSKICDVLLKQNDQQLKDIANSIIAKL